MDTYRTFTRAAKNFDEFSSAPKHYEDENLSHREALDACNEFNTNRSADQIDRGVKMEFERE